MADLMPLETQRVTDLFPEDNTLPLVVGYQYRIGSADVWVQIYAIDDKFVYARGVGNTQADIKEPKWKFDDLVGDYRTY